MGRTLHYEITNKKNLTPKEKKIILDIQDEFNEKYNWTCENFWLGKEQFGAGFRGFVKVASNEYNAFLVTSAITLISIKLPTIKFTLGDEGKFLLFPLQIRAGKAKIDMEDLIKSLEYWKKRGFEDLIKETHEKLEGGGFSFSYTWKETMGERVTYECPSKGIRETVPEMQYEMENISIVGNEWKPVKDFCRKVDPKDFENHPEFQACVISLDDGAKLESGTPSQIMSGFGGEYYGKKSVAEVAMESQQTQKKLFDVLSFLTKEGMLSKTP